ncbi:hypothetical protein AGMMS50267_00240 [Spirochaetia bacterium]|nr:hypothetical protein AGMMS50267_00240 [Spirochaetia bacterium]
MVNELSPDHNIPWHPAFFEAIQMELEAYKDVLEFKYEYQLTTDPLRIDTLIIKKPKDVKIDKNFAQMFRSENICEFKSPGDYLSVKDFYKTMGYAYIYAGTRPEVDISDITLTFVEAKYPRELVKYLTEVRGYAIEEAWPGIYHVSGDFFPIQIIESKKLSQSDNIWLKSLNNSLDFSGLGAIFKASNIKGKNAPIQAYLYAIIQANPHTLKEVTMSDLTVDDVLMEAGYIPRWLEEGREMGREIGREEGREEGREIAKKEDAKNFLALGISPATVATATGLDMETIKQLSEQ